VTPISLLGLAFYGFVSALILIVLKDDWSRFGHREAQILGLAFGFLAVVILAIWLGKRIISNIRAG
jgi:hypothetical protein